VPNDDRVGCGHRHAWVIDGATDLGEPGLLGDRGGAAWLAAEAHAAFQNATGPIDKLCEDAFRTIAAGFLRDRTREPIASWELPRAAFAVVTIEESVLSCAFVGDCTVLHSGGSGVTRVTPPPDRVSERAAAAALGVGLGAPNAKSDAVRADRRAARSLLSTFLGIDAKQAMASTAFCKLGVRPGDSLLLMTDGFSELVDAYQAYDPTGLFVAVESRGLAVLADELRKIEHDDEACLRFPRFKVSDDATAIWLRVNPSNA
jgi:serine/threonine protein phosphatase PrpC